MTIEQAKLELRHFTPLSSEEAEKLLRASQEAAYDLGRDWEFTERIWRLMIAGAMYGYEGGGILTFAFRAEREWHDCMDCSEAAVRVARIENRLHLFDELKEHYLND